MNSNKEKYKIFCRNAQDIPVFSQPWWLDTLTGKDNWDVILYEKNDEIFATWPFILQKKWGFRILTSPLLTPNLGIRIFYHPGQKYATKLSYEKEVITNLISQLPPFAWFKQNFHYDFQNWLPLYWHGFKQTTNYTYVLNELENLNLVYSNFMPNIRREIKKADRKLEIREIDDVLIFYRLLQKTFHRQKKVEPFSLGMLQKLDAACFNHKARTIMIAIDKQGNVHSGHYYVWDSKSVYYLMGGSDPKFRNSGAASLLMWEGIKLASRHHKFFDFEGSMIEPIERFFRAFGAVQKPYFHIEKINSPFIRLKRCLF